MSVHIVFVRTRHPRSFNRCSAMGAKVTLIWFHTLRQVFHRAHTRSRPDGESACGWSNYAIICAFVSQSHKHIEHIVVYVVHTPLKGKSETRFRAAIHPPICRSRSFVGPQTCAVVELVSRRKNTRWQSRVVLLLRRRPKSQVIHVCNGCIF